MVLIRTLVAVVTCCALAGLTGCGSSSSSSSTTRAARASAGSGTVQSPVSSTTSSRSTAAGSGASKDTRGGAVARSGSTGRSDSTSGSTLSRSYGSLATVGQPAGAGDKTAVLAAFHSYLGAIGDGNWDEACQLLSTSVKRALARVLVRAHGIPHHGCVATLGALLGPTPQSRRRQQEPTSIVGVRTNGDHAYILYRSYQLPHAAFSMLRESGRWTAGVLVAAGSG